MEKRDNYAIAAANARRLFLSYDQQKLIEKLRLAYDDTYLYTTFLGDRFRIRRTTGDMERQTENGWTEANGFNEVLTLFDLLCDSKPDRHPAGKMKSMTDFGLQFHQNLMEDTRDPFTLAVQENQQGFAAACLSLGGRAVRGADLGVQIPVFEELTITLLFWAGDEEFAPRLRFLWDENALQYLKYETMYYAVGYLKERLAEKMAQ